MKLLPSLIAGPALILACTEFFAAVGLLFRVRLATLVAMSALCGALLTGQGLTWAVVAVSLAVWLLAAGCSALNQLQEIDIDGRMSRTCERPLPRGLMAPSQALWCALLVLILGLLLLLPLGPWPLALGLLAVVWYHLVYTPLKRKTAWAVFPGAICGALPPLMGYTAAGGVAHDPLVVLLAGTLVIWQVPHFWLLAWRYRQDQFDSGLPTIFDQLNEQQFFAINKCWLTALFACYLFFGFFNIISNPWLTGLFLTLLVSLVSGIVLQLVRGVQRADPSRLFQMVNLSLALLLLTLILDSVL